MLKLILGRAFPPSLLTIISDFCVAATVVLSTIESCILNNQLYNSNLSRWHLKNAQNQTQTHYVLWSVPSRCPCFIYGTSTLPGRTPLWFPSHLAALGLYWPSPQDKFPWFTIQTTFCSCFILCISTVNALFGALIITVAWVDWQVSCCVKDPVEKQKWSLERRADRSYVGRNRESGKKSDTEEWFGEQIGQNNVHFWWQVLWAVARGKGRPLGVLKHRAVRQCAYSSLTLLFLPVAHPSDQILLFHYSFVHLFIHAFIQIKLL